MFEIIDESEVKSFFIILYWFVRRVKILLDILDLV